MRKIVFGLILLCKTTILLQAQSRYEIDRILDQRDSLVERNSYLKEKNSGIFGNKTKRDLRNTIETLEEIIRKDTELVMALRSINIHKEYRLSDKSRALEERIAELEAEANRYRRLYAKKEKELDYEKENKMERDENKNTNHKIILFLLLSNILFFVLWRRAKKTPVKP